MQGVVRLGDNGGGLARAGTNLHLRWRGNASSWARTQLSVVALPHWGRERQAGAGDQTAGFVCSGIVELERPRQCISGEVASHGTRPLPVAEDPAG